MQMDEAKMDLLAPQVPFEPMERSAARMRYSTGATVPSRFQSTNRRQPAPHRSKEKTWRERMAFQAIVCGGFLALLLLFNVLDTPLTNNVTNWVEQNLSYNILHEDGGVGAWADRLLGIFSNDDTPITVETFVPTTIVPVNIPPADSPDDSWIEQNLLRELNEAPDIYYENNR